MRHIAENLAVVRSRIQAAVERFGRNPGEVALLAVSKTQRAPVLRAAYLAGQRDFGENYLQEALEKMADLSDCPLVWHFIGAVQSNKTKQIAHFFQWVHSVDRIKTATRLNDQRPAHLPPLNVCLSIHLDDNPRKSGLEASALREIAQSVLAMPRLRLRGLMAIPEPEETFERQRAAFQRVRILYATLKEAGFPLDTLSLGMSHDLEAAIAEGSTQVRVGTAIFGPRG